MIISAWRDIYFTPQQYIAFQVAYVSRLATYITDLTINHTCAIFNPFNLLHYSTYIQWYDLFFALGVPSTIPLRCFRSLDRSLIDFFFLSLPERRKAGLVFENWDSNPCPLPHHFSTLLATISRAFSFRFQSCCVHRISYFKIFSPHFFTVHIFSLFTVVCVQQLMQRSVPFNLLSRYLLMVTSLMATNLCNRKDHFLSLCTIDCRRFYCYCPSSCSTSWLVPRGGLDQASPSYSEKFWCEVWFLYQ